jgi:nucleotide-binding universal stress UspA family protein
MKNILVPIDFSDASFNAVSYAAFLANAFHAELILLHAYNSTGVISENGNTQIDNSPEEIETADEKFIRNEMDGIVRRFTVKIGGIIRKGSPVQVIEEVAKELDPEIIVMGMKGKGESISAFGSTTVKMITRTLNPLLVIPANAGYQTINTITLASDFKRQDFQLHFPVLEQLIKRFHPFVEILNIQKKDSKLTPTMIAGKMATELIWDKYDHSFNIIEKNDVEKGIHNFIKNHPTDLLVMIARTRHFFNQMFEPSHTKKMTALTKTPLLIFHEQAK